MDHEILDWLDLHFHELIIAVDELFLFVNHLVLVGHRVEQQGD